MAKKEKDKDSEPQVNKNTGLSSQDLLASLLTEHAEHHFQGRFSEPYTVSTGSLKLDRKLGGGLPAGMHRFCGITEGGKSSESLEVIRNFLMVPKRKAFYVDAEGRLSPNVQDRSGVKLVFKQEEWAEGTCFVFKCNIFETVGGFMRALIVNNDEQWTYAFVIDSMDALIKKDDLEKELDEAEKVAAAANMTSSLFKRLNLPMGAGGHLCILISQVRSKMKIDTYGPKLAPTLGMFSGGNAALHYANFIFEFLERYQDDYIYENAGVKDPTKRGKTLGKLVKIRIAKSANETTGDTITYPIKNGRAGGKSIWVEREIVEELVVRAIVYPKGPWLYWSEPLLAELKAHFDTVLPEPVPAGFQGRQKLYDFVENNSIVRDYLYNYIINL